MKYIFFICFIPIIFSSPYDNIEINSDDDCWSNENNKTIKINYAILVKFSPKIAYGKDSCSVHIISPWLANMQNGFGLFLSQKMDCSSTVTVDCLSDNRTMPTPMEFTCDTSVNKIEMPCSSISVTFKRDIKTQEIKKTTFVQVVALAKEPCIDDDIFFQCPNDYPHSCIDKKLQCNGRSECPSGADEYNCHPKPPSGMSIFVIILIISAFLFVICVFSTVLIFCCCRAVFNGIVQRFSSRKGKKSTKSDVTVTGEDAGLMKGLTAPTTVVEMLPQQYPEPAPLLIDSTKPVYPRLE